MSEVRAPERALDMKEQGFKDEERDLPGSSTLRTGLVPLRTLPQYVLPSLPLPPLEDVIPTENEVQGLAYPVPVLFISSSQMAFSQLFLPNHLATNNINFSSSEFEIIGHSFTSQWLIMLERNQTTKIWLYNIQSHTYNLLPDLPNELQGQAFSHLSCDPMDPDLVIVVIEIIDEGLRIYRRFGAAPAWVLSHRPILGEHPMGFVSTPLGILWIDTARGVLNLLRNWELAEGATFHLIDLGEQFLDVDNAVPITGVGGGANEFYFLLFNGDDFSLFKFDTNIYDETIEVNFYKWDDLDGLTFYVCTDGNGFAIEPDPDHLETHTNKIFCSSWLIHDCVSFNLDGNQMIVQPLKSCYAQGAPEIPCGCQTKWFLVM